MLTFLITILLALVVLTLLFLLFRSLKTPYYRVDVDRMIQVVEMCLTGQATENDWQVVFGMSIRHHPELEAIRQRCLDIEESHYLAHQRKPYLFSEEGMAALREVLAELKQISNKVE